MERVFRESTLNRIPIILLLAALVVYPLLWRSPPIVAGDSAGYQAVARDLQDGTLDELHSRAPGYPLLLLLTGSTDSPSRALFLITLSLHFLGVYLLVSVLHSLRIPPLSVMFFCILLVMPPFVEPSAYVLTEGPSGFFLVATFWCLLRVKSEKWSPLLAGLAAGCAAMTRPTYQLLGFALAAIFATEKEIKKALCIILAFSLVVGGFSVFNWLRFGYLGVVPRLGLSLSTRTVRFVDRLPDNPVKKVLLDARNASLVNGQSHTGYMYIWAVEKRLSEVTGLKGPDLDRFMLRLNLKLILASPLEYLADVGRAFWTYWFPSTSLANAGSRKLQAAWAFLHFVLLGLFWLQLVALIGVTLTHGLRAVPRPWVYACIFGAVIVFYTMAVSCLIEIGNPRYRTPSDSLIVFMTVVGMHAWRRERGFRKHA